MLYFNTPPAAVRKVAWEVSKYPLPVRAKIIESYAQETSIEYKARPAVPTYDDGDMWWVTTQVRNLWESGMGETDPDGEIFLKHIADNYLPADDLSFKTPRERERIEKKEEEVRCMSAANDELEQIGELIHICKTGNSDVADVKAKRRGEEAVVSYYSHGHGHHFDVRFGREEFLFAVALKDGVIAAIRNFKGDEIEEFETWYGDIHAVGDAWPENLILQPHYEEPPAEEEEEEEEEDRTYRRTPTPELGFVDAFGQEHLVFRLNWGTYFHYYVLGMVNLDAENIESKLTALKDRIQWLKDAGYSQKDAMERIVIEFESH